MNEMRNNVTSKGHVGLEDFGVSKQRQVMKMTFRDQRNAGE